MEQLPTVAIDFRWLDHLNLGNGQFRYAVDLICGLAELDAEMRFVILGSRAEPVGEIAGIFGQSDKWRYEAWPRLTGRGWLYREQWRYFELLRGWTTSPLKPKDNSNVAPERSLKIDLVHALHSFVPLWPPVPVVETVYDLMPELFPEYANNVESRDYRMHKWAFNRFAARAIAISHTTANDLERLWKYPARQIDVVYLGAKLPEVGKAVARSEVPTILAPYNLEPRKNLSRLLEAMAKMKAADIRFKLVLFGRAAVDDEREARFQSEILRHPLESSVELTGRVSDEELMRLYRACSVFVFPSLYEGFGLPVLEAMSAGARVVAHHKSAMAEVLGDAGYLIDMTDAGAISQAIQQAMKNEVIGDRASMRARQFTRERMAKETLAVYRKVLKPRA